MAVPFYKKKRVKVLLGLVVLFIVGLISLYYLVQSPRFLRFVINRLNQSISGTIHYDFLKLDLENRNLTLKGFVYKNKQDQKTISLNSLELDFSPVSALKANLEVIRLRAEGLVIDQRNTEKSPLPSAWRTTVRLLLKRISVTDSLIDHMDIYLRNGDSCHFDQTTVSLSPQMAGEQKVAVWVNNSLLKLAGQEIKSSTLLFEGQIKIPVLQQFTFLVSEAKGKFTLQEVELGKMPVTSFNSDFRIGGETLYLQNGLWNLPDGTMKVDLDYIPKESTYKVDLKTTAPLPMKAIPKVSKHLMETFEKFELSLRAELQGFKLDQMSGKIEFNMKTLGNKANPQTPENNLDLKGKLKNGQLQLENLKIHSAKTDLTATGWVDFAKMKLDTQVKTKGFDLNTLVSCFSDLDLLGYVNSEGTIKGDFKSPEFIFDGQGFEAGYSFLRFGKNSGQFKITQGTLSYEGKAPADAGYDASVSVRTENIFRPNKHTVLKTQFTNIDVSQLLENPDIKGKVSGNFDLEDLGEAPPTGTLNADIHDFWLEQFHIGEIHAEGKLGNRRFVLNPVSFQAPKYEKITLPKEAVFEFDDRGVKLQAEILPGGILSGSYQKNDPNKFNLEADLTRLDLRPLMATLEMTPVEAYADGKVKMVLGLNKTPTTIDIHLSKFNLPLEEGRVEAAEPIEINIRPPNINFTRVKFQSGGETFTLGGQWALGGNSKVHLSGKLNLALLKNFPAYFREGSGFADLNLDLSGTREHPEVSGDVTFLNSAINLRAIRGTIEDLNGKILAKNNIVQFDNLKGTLAEGDVILNGQIALKDFQPSAYDLKIEAREASISEPQVYKLVFSGAFSLKGTQEKPTLAGKIFLSDGRYSRDFNITQFILKPQEKSLPTEPNPLLKNLELDLEIKSSGDLAIKNNIARMYLQTDLRLKGPMSHPKISGALEILEGEFHYFKIDFENAKGVIDFRDPTRGPYVDVTANKEFTQRFNSTTVTAHIQGFTENLQLTFVSDTGLSKRDILALVFTGALPGEGGLTSTQIASTVVASQLSSILQDKVASKAQLDIFRFEATDPDSKNLSTLVVGKRLTERLSLEFKTDLGVDDPLQGIQMEFLLLDNVLLEASQFSNGAFNFNFTLRWKSF